MQYKRQNAVCFLLAGSFLIFDATANLSGITGWVSDLGRFAFMVALLIAGILLCWMGWTRLSSLKKEIPNQTWWQFLKVELIAVSLLVLLGAVIWALPEGTRESIMQTMRELIETTHVIKGGHP